MKSYKSFFFVIAFFLVIQKGIGQSDPDVYQFNHTKLLFNPAYAGSNAQIEFLAIRNVWYPKLIATGSSVNPTPRYTGFAGSFPFWKNKRDSSILRSALSFSFLQSKAGISAQRQIQLGLNYTFDIGKKSTLRVGVNSRYEQRIYNFSFLNSPAAFSDTDQSDGRFGVDAGTYFNAPTWHKFHAGISLKHIGKEEFMFHYGSDQASFQSLRHLYFTTGAAFKNEALDLEFRPSLYALRQFGPDFYRNNFNMETIVSYASLVEIGGQLSWQLIKNSRYMYPALLVAAYADKLFKKPPFQCRIGYGLRLLPASRNAHEITLNLHFND